MSTKPIDLKYHYIYKMLYGQNTKISMKNFLKAGVLFIAILSFFSCENKKDKLIKDFDKVYRYIDTNNYDSLLLNVDAASIDFIDYLSDTSNLNFEDMKKFGDKHNLPLFTTTYNEEFGKLSRTTDGDKNTFFTYLSLSGVPLFNLMSKPKVRDQKSKVSKEETYVVVGTKVNKNTYITSKIRFTKGADENYKLNILSLLKMREKILRQQFNNYVKVYQRNNRDKDLRKLSTDDYLRDFLKNMDKKEYELNELKYRLQ